MNGEDRDRDRAELLHRVVNVIKRLSITSINLIIIQAKYFVSNPEAITLNCYLIKSLIIKSHNLTYMDYASISATEHIRISSLLKQISTDVRIIVTGAGDSVG